MKPLRPSAPTWQSARRPAARALFVCLLLLVGSCPQCLAADAFSAWRKRQELPVTTPGLVKIQLPADTVSALRPAREDLRLTDPSGAEVPYTVELPTRPRQVIAPPREFRVAVEDTQTVVSFEREPGRSLVAIRVVSPANDFLKSMTLEEATPTAFRPVVANLPLYRQPGGASQLVITLPKESAATRFRLIADDRRGPPIPVSGIELVEIDGTSPAREAVTSSVVERNDVEGKTRLLLDLGGVNFRLACLRVETPETWFHRTVSVFTRQVEEGEVRERMLSQKAIHRVANPEGRSGDDTELAMDVVLPTRELLVTVDNGDSPPLEISAVRLERWPVYVLFQARQPGVYTLWADNPRAGAPRYDLAGVAAELKRSAAASAALGPLQPHAGFRDEESLPQVALLGAAITTNEWAFRKELPVTPLAIQQVELDLDVLAHSQTSLADLRLVSGDRQVPYVLERTSFSRRLTPRLSTANDPKKTNSSRWAITLPTPSLPILRFESEVATQVFQRELRAYEEVRTDRGETVARGLGSAAWHATPDHRRPRFELILNSRPSGDTVYLETYNGDNAAIDLVKVEAVYPLVRLLFKAPPSSTLALVYGNPAVSAPRYDLSLIAGEVLAAKRFPATLGRELQIGEAPWLATGRSSSVGTAFFWGVLGLVVVGLLFVIIRLVPKAPSDSSGAV